MPNSPTIAQVRAALEHDLTIDIVTIGAKSGRPRKTEIWFTNIDGQIILCGTPAAEGGSGVRAKRDWLANMMAMTVATNMKQDILQTIDLRHSDRAKEVVRDGITG